MGLRVMTLLFNTGPQTGRDRKIFVSLREFLVSSVLHKSTFHFSGPIMRCIIGDREKIPPVLKWSPDAWNNRKVV